MKVLLYILIHFLSDISLGGCKPMQLDHVANAPSTQRLREVENGEMNFVVKKQNQLGISHKAHNSYKKNLKIEDISEDLSLKDQDPKAKVSDEKLEEKDHLQKQVKDFLNNQTNQSIHKVLKPFENLDNLNVKNFDELLDLLYGNYFGESAQMFLINVMMRSSRFNKSNAGYLDHQFENLDPEGHKVYRFKTQRKLPQTDGQNTLHEQYYSLFKLMNPKGDMQTKALSHMSLKRDIPKDLLSFKNYKFLSELVIKDSKDPDITKLAESIISIPIKTIDSRQYPLQENFIIGSAYDLAIKMAVDVLRKDLDDVYRIWALGILQLLQSFLPQGQLHPIILNIEKGFTRGEFELSLLKDINLQFVNFGRFVGDSIPEIIEDVPALKDSLERGKLLSEINMTLQEEKFTPSDRFVGIYDTLLLQKSPIPIDISDSLSFKCFYHMTNRDIPTIEKFSTMAISEYLHFGKSEASQEWKKDLFQRNLSKFVAHINGNSLFKNLLRPFCKVDEVNDSQIEGVIEALKNGQFNTPTEAICYIHTLKVTSRYNEKILSHLNKNQEIIDHSINILKKCP
ncbi:uncharacterized protein MELLADRAFT_109934 [Melampsora larici-populina 98AG31]|uniref:Secreted protein n=1 Tax=Melampsora larici-populina (strain 98AG31 / pathotype 3-4-7) TaxID=747676 RepID=F4RY40_MELLP|nr:uncharacterized protein MELLADRAFT_109934 [Melampsora larici-populina 98AG31]EGG02706.1 hypothetical protein MELLADRAFT_109934 [Melampsora larici-populina 98AG31]